MQFQKSKGIKQNWALNDLDEVFRSKELAGAKTDLLTKDKRKDVTNYIQRADYTTRQDRADNRKHGHSDRTRQVTHGKGVSEDDEIKYR